MNILIVTQMFWPESFLVNELSEELAKRGHKVTVYTGLPNYPKGELFTGYRFFLGPWHQQRQGYTIIRNPLIPRGRGFVRLAINYLSFVFFATVGLWRLRREKFDACFVYAPSPITVAIPAIVYKFWRKTPVVIWLQDLWPDSVASVGALSKDGAAYHFIGNIVRWIYKHTDKILMQSAAFKENLETFGFKRATSTIPNWAPEIKLDSQVKPDWIPAAEGLKVCFAGNIGKAQAIDTIMAAAESLQEEAILFYIVGDGSELNRVQNLAAEKKLAKVFFLGRHPPEEMPALFAWADVLLVSLKKDPNFAKTIPSKIQAYLAAGKPIMASLDGAGAQVITQAKCGFCSPAEDAKALAQALRKLSLLSHDERKRMGDNAISYFQQNFDKNIVIERIIKSLEFPQ